MMRIVLDPGHLHLVDGQYLIPGKRSPRVPPGIYEGEFNRKVALQVYRTLQQSGYSVFLTVPQDARENVTLADRVAMADDLEADAFISIHANAADVPGWSRANGAVIFTGSHTRDPLARGIADGFQTFTSIRLRRGTGVVSSPRAFYVIRKQLNKRPAVLVECGFMTNRLDAEYMASEGGQKQIAQAIVSGVYSWAS